MEKGELRRQGTLPEMVRVVMINHKAHKNVISRGGGGGLPPIFFPDNFRTSFTLLGRGIPSVHNTDLRGDKQKKKKKAHLKFRGGGGLCPHLKFRGGTRPPPPSPRFRRL